METESCQNAIVTDEGGKKVTYFLEQNAVSKKFHSNICKAKKKVTATGTVEEKDGEMVLTASKIELGRRQVNGRLRPGASPSRLMRESVTRAGGRLIACRLSFFPGGPWTRTPGPS